MVRSVEQFERKALQLWIDRSPHGHAATIQGPEIPSIGELKAFADRLNERLAVVVGMGWVAAGSLVGFEVLDLLVGSMLATPEFVPIVILVLAIVWVVRERSLRRFIPGLRRRRWIKRADLR